MEQWGERLKRVEQLAQSFTSNPLTASYKPRLWPCQPSSVWKLFPRQSMAMSFAKSCKEAVHVFALEKEKSPVGQRIYLVTSYMELWHYYRTYRQSLMHCYEVIPEGAVCKLYFDLEFHKPSNNGADGKTMVSSLIQYVCEKLKEVYGIECSAKNVLNLDSSTEDKFSRHLIFNLPNAAFKDNIHVGSFIHGILQQLKTTPENGERLDFTVENSGTRTKAADADEMIQSPQAKKCKLEKKDLSFLRVKNKDGQDCLFVDLGVYTKNRNFRLYKSSKLGKNAAFIVAEDNKFTAKVEKGVSAEESIFMASLVCNVSSLFLDIVNVTNHMESDHFKSELGYFHMWSQIGYSFTGQRILMFLSETQDSKTTNTHRLQGSDTHPAAAVSLSGCQSSPHQELDNFVLSLVQKDGIQGIIRRWSYFATEQLLVYDIAKYRWCENVGRFHKSNNIMIVVDLKEEAWYQKCHDPDCRSFRSSSYPLPQEICISYILTLDEDDQAYLMDDAGNIEPSPAPHKASQTTVCPKMEPADVWGDDQDYLESLDEFEHSSGEISDELLLKCVTDFDSQ